MDDILAAAPTFNSNLQGFGEAKKRRQARVQRYTHRARRVFACVEAVPVMRPGW